MFFMPSMLKTYLYASREFKLMGRTDHPNTSYILLNCGWFRSVSTCYNSNMKFLKCFNILYQKVNHILI